MPDEKWTRYLALQLSRKASISVEAATQVIREQEAAEARAKNIKKEQRAELRQKKKQLKSDPAVKARRKAIKERSKKAGTYVQILQGGAPGLGRKS
ncbi:MAG: hypothetical protein NUV80_05570 [Candidatus Berkelbacteria bacterium]|nr:hypothetical protein [Candidatus Berkelbacteria bacterium]